MHFSGLISFCIFIHNWDWSKAHIRQNGINILVTIFRFSRLYSAIFFSRGGLEKIKLPHIWDSSKRLINQVFRQGRWHQGCRRGVRSEHILSGSWHASSLHRALLYRSWLSWPVCVRVPTTLLSPPLLISRVGDLDYRRIKNYIPCIDVTIHWQISKNALLKITFAVKGK